MKNRVCLLGLAVSLLLSTGLVASSGTDSRVPSRPPKDVRTTLNLFDAMVFSTHSQFEDRTADFGECAMAAVAVNRAAVAVNGKVFEYRDEIQPGDQIAVSLFAGEQLLLNVETVGIDVNSIISVRGRIDDGGWDAFYLSIDEETLYLTLNRYSSGTQYTVLFNSNAQGHYLFEVPFENITLPENLPAIIPPVDATHHAADISTFQEVQPTGGPLDDAFVTVMVVYTPAAASWANTHGGGIHNVINQAMQRAQTALDNSNTFLTLHLVHAAQVDYSESGVASLTTLNRLQNPSDGHMDEVHAWRNAYGADLVALLAHVNDTGGLGYALVSSHLPGGLPNWAFSLTRVQQAAHTYTFIHELGHNMGAGHHKYQNYQTGPQCFSYSAGWRWQAGGVWYNSVMSYSGGNYFNDPAHGAGITSTPVPYFSNPSINHLGVATGHATHADNARTLRETKHIIANYRPDVSVGTLTVNINPADVRAAGARWSINGGTSWHTSGSRTVPAGTYTVQFNDVEGWAKPNAETVSVVADGSTVLSREYQVGPPPSGVDIGFRAIALDNRVMLRWNRPTSLGFSSDHVRIRVSTSGYPTTADSIIYDSTDQQFLHQGLAADTTYYYAIWVRHGDDFVEP